MDYKSYIAEKLSGFGVPAEEIASAIAVPPEKDMGDFALPCFKFAKTMRKSPVMIANELCQNFVCDEVIAKVEAVNGYLNFRVNREGLVKESLAKILSEGESYGKSDIGNGKTVCID